MGYFHDYDGVGGDLVCFYDFAHGLLDVFVFGEALVEVVAPNVGVNEYHACSLLFFCGVPDFLEV